MATINLGSIKFKWQGAYAGGTAYTVDDVVSYQGSSYICIQASTGNLPTNATYWEQMSSAGTNGTDGTDLTTTLTTQGDILYRDGSGLARLGAGTAGQVLQSGGTGANVSWTNVSSDFVKLASGSFSSNTLSFDGYFTSDYSQYKIILTDVIPSSNNINIGMRIRQSNADVTTSDYQNVGQHGTLAIASGDTNGTSVAENTNYFNLQQGYAVSNASNLSMNAEVTLFNVLNTSLYKHYHYKSSQHYSSAVSGGFWVTSTGGGYYDANTNALSGFTIMTNSGNITSGNCYLYGVKA